MRALHLLMLLLLALLVVNGCGGGNGNDSGAQFGETPFNNVPGDGIGDPDANPQPQGNTTNDPTVPKNAAPPVGVTFHVAITENVSLSTMQQLYATFVAANNAVWRITEGQVRIHRIRFWDNISPGTQAFQFFLNVNAIDTTNRDIIVFPQQTWNIGAAGAVNPTGGRKNRVMMVPTNVNTFVLLHEIGHFLFELSWGPGPLLIDEYTDGVQDSACVMESQGLPWRFCAGHNHVSQTSQPTSCWQQILADYPRLTYSGSDTAPDLPAAPIAEYNNVP